MSDSRKVRSADEVLAAAGAARSRKKGGKRSKTRDARPTRTRYRAEHRREKNKVRRILRSNGEAAARMYASAKAIVHYVDEVKKGAGTPRVG